MKPKYQIGDKVWAIHENKVKELEIYGACIFSKQGPPSSISSMMSTYKKEVCYFISEWSIFYDEKKEPEYVQESKLFSSKEELIASL